MSGIDDTGLTKGVKKFSSFSLENLEYENKIECLMGELNNNTTNLKKNPLYENKNLIINKGKQDKHIVGTNNFQKGKSEITIDLETLQKLIYEKSGYGKEVNDDKERIDFGVIIGYYVEDGEKYLTTKGIIHYSKNGVHVVPSDPEGVF